MLLPAYSPDHRQMDYWTDRSELLPHTARDLLLISQNNIHSLPLHHNSGSRNNYYYSKIP